MNLQDQKKRTRRNFTLQDTMNCAKLRTNRKIELHENLCLDDEIDELQNYVHYHYH